MRKLWLPCLVLYFAGLLMAGCADDPYSRRRINIRTERMQRNWHDIEKAEIWRSQRLREQQEELRRWWARDEKRFRERSQRFGDYAW